MAFRLHLSEPVGEGMRRILQEQCAEAAESLRPGPDFSVHRARMCLKRARAALRLVRTGLRPRSFRALMGDLRTAAQALAPMRERAVLADTLGALATRHGEAVLPCLSMMSAALSPNEPADVTAIRGAHRRLAAVERRLAKLDFDRLGWRAIECGLAQTQRRMREAADQAGRRADDECFHALRRRVQDHWRQMHLLSHAWPDWFQARARLAHRLSQLLGEDHDLAALAAAAEAAGADPVVACCRKDQQPLRRRAAGLVDLLIADRPRPLARRIVGYWDAARRSASERDVDETASLRDGKDAA